MKPWLGQCQTCEGRCCQAENGLRFPHLLPQRPASPYLKHVCPDCYDGIYEICGDPEPWPKPVRTAEDERADVVARLRDVAATLGRSGDRCSGRIEALANTFERGEHVGASKKASDKV